MKKNPLIELGELFLQVRVIFPNRKSASMGNAAVQIAKAILRLNNRGNKVIIIGNGGSASIASHIMTDFIKNLKIPAIAFTDSSLLTCLSNDLGYEKVFSAPIKVLAKKGDMLFAVSSSGRSKNILAAVSAAKRKGCFVVTFSGFLSNNPLRKTGNINFYVPSSSYGAVEIAHLAICHAIVDTLCKR